MLLLHSFVFFTDLVFLDAQCVWETLKTQSVCLVNIFTVWPASDSGLSRDRCSVPIACSKLMMTSLWFLQL